MIQPESIDIRRPARTARALVVGLAAAVVLAACWVGPSTPPRDPERDPASPERLDVDFLARLVLRETNRERFAHHLRTLSWNAGLDRAAAFQASSMLLTMEASHDNPYPGRRSLEDRVEESGLSADTVAENILEVPALRPGSDSERRYTYGDLAARVVALWMASPGHRANLLEPSFTQAGCAVRCGRAPGGEEAVFVSEILMLPAAEPASRTQASGMIGGRR